MENDLVQHRKTGFQYMTTQQNDPFESFRQAWNPPDTEKPKKKTRGRKKLRPGNPLKTEVMDKYWLRSFRNFVRSQYNTVKTLSCDKEFWTWYMSKGKPGKTSTFLSYNTHYKEKLFSSQSFCALFAAWGLGSGFILNLKKPLKISWGFYFDYFYNELVPRCTYTAEPTEFNGFYQLVSGLVEIFQREKGESFNGFSN